MANSKGNGKGAKADLAEQLIAGTAKHFASITQLLLASGTFTPAQVTSELQSLVTLRSDADDARSVLQAKVAAETAQAITDSARLSKILAMRSSY